MDFLAGEKTRVIQPCLTRTKQQLIALVREYIAPYGQSSDGYSISSSLKQTSNNGFEWTGAVNDAGRKKGNSQPSIYINTNKNLRSSVCRYLAIVCTHKALAGRRNVCVSSSVSVQNGLMPLYGNVIPQNRAYSIQLFIEMSTCPMWFHRTGLTAYGSSLKCPRALCGSTEQGLQHTALHWNVHVPST